MTQNNFQKTTCCIGFGYEGNEGNKCLNVWNWLENSEMLIGGSMAKACTPLFSVNPINMQSAPRKTPHLHGICPIDATTLCLSCHLAFSFTIELQIGAISNCQGMQ